jgi:hypothetical protein
MISMNWVQARPRSASRGPRRAGVWMAGAACLLAGCSSLTVAPLGTPGKRHSPAEIAGYQAAQFSSPLASAAGAREAREKAMAAIAKAEAGGADDDTVMQALRAVAFYNTQLDAGRRIVRAQLADTVRPLAQRPPEFQRAVLTAAHTFDAEGSAPLLAPLLDSLATPRQFAIAAYTLLRADPGPQQRQRVRSALARRSDPGEPRLMALALALDRADGTAAGVAAAPPLQDLLAAPLKPGLPVLFSLQRRDRRQIGLAVVRDVDGRFVRDAQGSLFAVPHLALALSELPGTVTLGNTPQGLFTVVGAGTAGNPWIGPTPFLESKVPVEASVAEFTQGDETGPWTQAVYDQRLPASWRGWAPFHEAWLAGLAGRDEMLAHGTAADARPYLGQPYFPGTPTDGCLTAQEFWSADGRLQRSDQLALVRAYTRSGVDHGYLVVVEIDDAARPVVLEDVLEALLAAERQTAARR